MLIALTTTPNSDEAERLANAVVKAKLAACVQILPKMTSVYLWEGEVQTADEHLLLIKTLPQKWEELGDFIAANHSYEVPEIVVLDSRAAGPYLGWVTDALS